MTSAAKEEGEIVEIISELIAMRRMRRFLDISLLLFDPFDSLFTVEIMTFDFVKNL
jgi:hypothetical protein